MMFDTYNLQQVAQAVIKLNPHCAAMTEAELISRMQSLAYQELRNGATYCGTLGFMLTAYKPRWSDEINIKASISDCLSQRIVAAVFA